MDKLYGLSHLFMAVFLHNFSMFMVVPAITDVTMAALCPGQDECSLAIYITGFQQAVSLTPPIFHTIFTHSAFSISWFCSLISDYVCPCMIFVRDFISMTISDIVKLKYIN